MIDRLGVHRADDAEIIGKASGMRQQFAQPVASLPILFEAENGWRNREACLSRGHARDALAIANRVGQIFVKHVAQPRFVIKQIELRGSSRLGEPDDAFCFRREVWNSCVALCSGQLRIQQRSECRSSDPRASTTKKLATSDVE